MARITRFALAGLLGALVAWLILEPTPLMPDDARSITALSTVLVGLIIGGFVGFGIGLSSSLSGLSSRDGVKTIISGVLVGVGGGIVGLTLGNIIWTPFHNMESAKLGPTSPLVFLAITFGRSTGWALMGGFIGLSQGIAVVSLRKMINGMIGGLIGGGIGGLVFQLLASSGLFHPAIIRFISFAIMGFAIGFFIGLADELAKKAWLIKDLGRGEGKEFHLFRPVTVLGRDEYADVPVYGDSMVAKKHAQVVQDRERYKIEDLGSSTGTTVNGTRINSQVLKDGDIIHLGTNKFIFRTKGVKRTSTSTAAPAYIPPTANDGPVCPFCGGMKDAAGNCACSVTSPAPVQPIPTQSAQQTQVIQQPVVSTSAPSLVFMTGPYSGNTFTLISEQVIGRDQSKAIPLTGDATVSRNHARIFYDNNTWVIEDLGSANGTFVNDARVTRRELNNGDIIRLGSSTCRFNL